MKRALPLVIVIVVVTVGLMIVGLHGDCRTRNSRHRRRVGSARIQRQRHDA